MLWARLSMWISLVSLLNPLRSFEMCWEPEVEDGSALKRSVCRWLNLSNPGAAMVGAGVSLLIGTTE